jgi:hypothetical protein
MKLRIMLFSQQKTSYKKDKIIKYLNQTHTLCCDRILEGAFSIPEPTRADPSRLEPVRRWNS